MPVVRGLRRIAEVSPIIAYETGAGPRVKRTDTIRPREACANEDALDFSTVPAIPRARRNITLTREPHT
jgi:hypothetical protein